MGMNPIPLPCGPALGGTATTLTYRTPITRDMTLRGNAYVSGTLAADASHYYSISVALNGTTISTAAITTATVALTAGTPRAIALNVTEASEGDELQFVLSETGTVDTSTVLFSFNAEGHLA